MGEAFGQAGDFTDESVVEAFARRVVDTWDALVNNAGIAFISPAEHTAAKDYRRVLEVNPVAPFLLAKALGAKMLAARRACIVNVASIA